MSATDAVARMLTLVPWVHQRPGVTIAEIAEAFDTDERTIRSDLETLNYCGLPGGGGGDFFVVTVIADEVTITMADELKRAMRPTRAEALRLVLTVDGVAEILGDEVPALRSAVEKVRAALDLPEHTVDAIVVGAPPTLPQLQRAVADQLRVHLTYMGRKGEVTDRSVDPWAVQVVDGTWYLQGYDHSVNAERTFRVDRMGQMEVTDTVVSVTRPQQLDVPKYVPNDAHETVEIEVDARSRWVADVVMVDQTDEDPDGTARLRFRTDALAWVAQIVLMAAGGARVIAPPGLAAMVGAQAKAARANYA